MSNMYRINYPHRPPLQDIHTPLQREFEKLSVNVASIPGPQFIFFGHKKPG